MKKIHLAISAILLMFSAIVLSIKLNSPFGIVFWTGFWLTLSTFLSTLFIAAFVLWQKNVLAKIASFIFIVFGLILMAVTVISVSDYRLVIPLISSSPLSKEEALEDLEDLKSVMKSHPAYATISEKLENRLNTKPDEASWDQFVLEEATQRLGLFKDGHTFAYPFQLFAKSRYLPLLGYYFSDGFYIIRTSSEYSDLLHKRITHIGGVRVEELFKNSIEYSGPENEWNAKYRFNFYVFNTQFLEKYSAGYKNGALVSYIDSGTAKEKEVTSEPFMNWIFWSLKPIDDRTPVFSQTRNDRYTVDVRNNKIDLVLNSIQNQSPDFTMKMLSEDLDSILASGNIETLSIDIRNNLGGNNELYQPLIDMLIQHDYINDSSKLFVLTSRTTFSAGINFLEDMVIQTNCTVVGEPPGAGFTHYGDAELEILSNSGILYLISTKKWGRNPKDTARHYLPNRLIDLNFAAYQQGVDPWMEAIDMEY